MKYKGYELMQAIAEEKIKEESKFLCSTGDTYVYHDNYGLAYLDSDTLEEENTIDCNYAYSIWLNFTFELIEDKNETIDIQTIKELKLSEEDGIKITDIKIVLNKILEWSKKLDKQMHCKICEKELAVKYGVCEKCYENVNEDVR